MNNRNAFCSFCRKGHEVVGPLVEGPPIGKSHENAYICEECLELGKHIIDLEKKRRNPGLPGAPVIDAKTIQQRLDALFPTWPEANAVVAESASRRHGRSGRVLLVGSGQGSAQLLAKAVAFVLEAPFAAGNWQRLTETGNGYLLFDLLDAANFDLDLAQRGVVFVGGVESAEAQRILAELWRKNAVSPLENTPSPAGCLHIDLSGILFVCGAKLPELDETSVNSDSLRAGDVQPALAEAITGVASVPTLDEDGLMRLVHWIDFQRAFAPMCGLR